MDFTSLIRKTIKREFSWNNKADLLYLNYQIDSRFSISKETSMIIFLNYKDIQKFSKFSRF